MEIQPQLSREIEFDNKQKLPQFGRISPISAFEITNAWNIFRNVYRVNLYTEKIVHWNLGGKSPAGSFEEMSCNLKNNHMNMQILEFSTNQNSAGSTKN